LKGKKPDKDDCPYGEVYIQTAMAKEFGKGEELSDWVKALDKEMSIASFYAVKELKTAVKEKKKLDWEFVVSIMNNADGITQVPGSHKKVYETLDVSEGMSWFKFDGSPDASKINTIKTWFKQKLIGTDPKIYDNSLIVQNGALNRLAKIAAETGAAVDSVEHFFANHDSKQDKVLEIGVIRFPIKEEPFIKLFRIQIFAWFCSDRVLMVQKDQAGFDLELDVMHFKPVQAVVDKISDEFSTKMVDKLADPDTWDW